MFSTYFPVSVNAASTSSAAQTRAGSGQKTLDFSRILLAQMATPNISSLFGDQEENTSILGNSVNSLLGSSSTSSLLSQLYGNSTGQFVSPSMELSIWSNLIGKKIEALDTATNKKTSGTVSSVLLQNGVAMLEVSGEMVNPSSVIKVQ